MFIKNIEDLKSRIKNHWEKETCGARYGFSDSSKQFFEEIKRARYSLEPYIPQFAGFAQAKGKQILEIGVGAGTDFCHWIDGGAQATGIDITKSAIIQTKQNLNANGLKAQDCRLYIADAEKLPFPNKKFDLVYSWGVLHHTPNTYKALQEIYRVLKSTGQLKIMIYHVPSLTGWGLWIQHGLLKGRPFLSARDAIYQYLESPGTKAYTRQEAKDLLTETGFKNIHLITKLGPGDLLKIKPSKKYQSPIFKLIWALYPRFLIKMIGNKFGLYLLIEAEK